MNEICFLFPQSYFDHGSILLTISRKFPQAKKTLLRTLIPKPNYKAFCQSEHTIIYHFLSVAHQEVPQGPQQKVRRGTCGKLAQAWHLGSTKGFTLLPAKVVSSPICLLVVFIGIFSTNSCWRPNWWPHTGQGHHYVQVRWGRFPFSKSTAYWAESTKQLNPQLII